MEQKTIVKHQASSFQQNCSRTEREETKILEPQEQKNQDQPVEYTRRDGTSGMCGQLYEVKLLMWFLLQGISKKEQEKIDVFYLATNMLEAGDFDDVVFKCRYKENGVKKSNVIFLQAKHFENPEKQKISIEHKILSDSNKKGDFALKDYFKSYLEIREKFSKRKVGHPIFEDEFENCNFFIFTNCSFSDKRFKKIETKQEDIFNFGKSNCYYKIVLGQDKKFDEKVMNVLQYNYKFEPDLKKLAKELIKLIFPDKMEENVNYNIQYRLSLVEKFIVKKLSQENVGILGKCFLDDDKSLSKQDKKFREVFFEELKEIFPDPKTSRDKLILVLRNKEIKLPDYFQSTKEEFLNNITFFWNQYSENELDEIIKKKIQSIFRVKKDETELIFAYTQNQMQIWWMYGGYYITENNLLFQRAKQNLFKLSLVVLVLFFCGQIERLQFRFKDNQIEDLIQSIRTKQVVTIITNEATLRIISIKVYQALESMNEYKSNNCNYKYIFMSLNQVFILKDIVLDVFNCKDINLLVIECDTVANGVLNYLHSQLFKIVLNNSEKRIILITHKKDDFADQFRCNILKNSETKNKYEEQTDNQIILTDLTIEAQQNLLENGQVMFQGEALSLGSIIDDNYRHLINAEVLTKLIKNETIEINKSPFDLGEVKYYYIDREFKRQVKIKKSILEDTHKNKSKFRFVKNEDCTKRLSFPKNRDIVILTDENGNFKDLSGTFDKHNIHWLLQKKNELVWQRSQGSLSNLREFVESEHESIEKVKPKKITDIDDQLVIVAAEPGMGKSTVLTYLATEQSKQIDVPLWLSKINLRDHSSKFCIWNKDKIKIDKMEAVKFLYEALHFFKTKERYQILTDISDFLTINNRGELFLKHEGEPKIEGLALFEIHVFNYFFNQGKIVLLFDGFDEISPNYEEKVIELLHILKGTKVKLWVTTRVYCVQSRLEDRFSTFSYTLMPFLEKDQKSFLEKFWKTNLKLEKLDSGRFNVFTGTLLKWFSKNINNQEREFLGISLHASMFAKVFQNDFKTFYDSKSLKLSSENKKNLSEKLNLITLYERFIYVKFYEIRFGEKKHGVDMDDIDMQNVIEKERKDFVENHKKYSLYTLFQEDVYIYFPELKNVDMDDLIDKIRQGIEKNGIIKKVIDNRLQFVHHTFAEYFAAEYIWGKFKSLKLNEFQNQNNILTLMEKLFSGDRFQISIFFYFAAEREFLKDINLSDENYKIVMLLEQFIPKINKLYNEYKNTGRDHTKGTDDLDNIGGCLMHAHSIKLFLQLVELFLLGEEAKGCKIITDSIKNLTLNFGLFCMSAEAGCISIVKLLISSELYKVEELKNNKWYYNPLWLAAKNNHLNLVRLLSKIYTPNSVDQYGKTILQRVLQNNEFNVLRSCLCLDILQADHFNSPILFNDKTNYSQIPLVHAYINHAPSDVIELLIKKTDITCLNQYKVGNLFAINFVIESSLSYDKNILDALLKKSIDVNIDHGNKRTPVNVLIFEYIQNGLLDPIRKLKGNYYPCVTFFHSDLEYLNFFNIMKLLLEHGAIYNSKCYHGGETVQNVTKVYYIHELLKEVYGLVEKHNYGIDKILDELSQKVLEVIFNKYNVFPNISWKFEGSEICMQEQNSKTGEVVVTKKIPCIPSYIGNLLLEAFKTNDTNGKVRKDIVDELSCHIKKFRNEIEGIKNNEMKFEKSNYFNVRTIISKLEKQNKISFNICVSALLEKVIILYLNQDYEIIDSLNEVKEEILKFEQKINYLLHNFPQMTDKKGFTHDKLFHLLAISSNNLDETKISKINEIFNYGGIDLLNEILHELNYVGKETKLKTLQSISLYFEQSFKTMKLFRLIKDVHSATDMSEIVKFLEKAHNDVLLKAVVNAKNENQESILHLAAAKGNLDVIAYVVKHSVDIQLAVANEYKNVIDDKKHDFIKAVVNPKNKYKYTALHIAAANGHLNIIKYLIEDKGSDNADVCARNRNQNTVLHLAAAYGHLHIIKYLINDEKYNIIKAVICTENKRQNTILHLAAANGHLNIIEYIFEHLKSDFTHASFMSKNKKCNTVLHLAVVNNHIGIVKYILKYQTFGFIREIISSKNRNKNTVLHLAAANGYIEIIKCLLDDLDLDYKKKAVSAENKNQNNVLHLAAANGHNGIIQYLVKILNSDFVTALVSAKNKKQNTALHLAAANGRLNVIKYLIYLQNSSSIREIFNATKNSNQNTAIHLAARYGHLNIINFFFHDKRYHIMKSIVSAEDQNTILHIACGYGQLHILEYLDKQKHEFFNTVITSKNKNQNTVLHLAAANGHLKIIKYLNEEKPDFFNTFVSSKNKNHDTVLHLAAANGRLYILKYLNEEKSDFFNEVIISKNKKYNTVLHLAAANGRLDILKYLNEEKSDFFNAFVSSKNKNDDTVLHLAAANGRLDVVKFIIHGKLVDFSAKNKNGESALLLANEKKHFAIVDFLNQWS